MSAASATEDRVAVRASHEEVVDAPYQVLFDLLVDKVYHPERAVPGVSNTRILNDGGAEAGVERKMFNSGKNSDIHEIITWQDTTRSDGTRYCIVTFKMLSDPKLEGTVTNEAWEVIEEGGAKVTHLKYEMKWDFQEACPVEARTPPFPAGAAPVMRGAVLMMKGAAEKAAAEATAAS